MNRRTFRGGAGERVEIAYDSESAVIQVGWFDGLAVKVHTHNSAVRAAVRQAIVSSHCPAAYMELVADGIEHDAIRNVIGSLFIRAVATSTPVTEDHNATGRKP